MTEMPMEMVQVQSELAISISNAFKSFSPNINVLNGLNMSISSGSIYGLLGPSGCGKTTLINIILGKLPLDSGSIKLNTSRLSDIGYMPQDLCLDTMLTINETFYYYGSLYNMKRRHINSRNKELIDWLKLPPGKTLLKTLSGGQCRRVSLAVTLLHNPKIIILDEPTVGIDPVLRYEIWQTLLKIVKEQAKTIIITTHYIEEAHQAQTIGLMRNGVLIEETSPQDILFKENTNSLEEAFLSISRNQNFVQTAQMNKTFQKRNVSSAVALHSDNGMSFTRICAFINKHLAICFRDSTFIFYMIFLPILASVIFNMAIGRDIRDVRIAVRNNEVTYCPQNTLINNATCLYDDNNNLTLSCDVLNGLRELKYNLVEVINEDMGDILVKKVDSIAYIQFPQNFSKGLQQYALGTWFSGSEYDTKKSLAYVNVDVGNFLVKNQVIQNIGNILENVIFNSTRACNKKFAKHYFKSVRLVGDKVHTFIHSIATMFVTMIGFYFSSLISTGFMLTEKMEGLLDRSMTAGITILEVMISIAYIQTVIHFIQSISVMFVTYVVFKNPIEITNGLFAFAFMLCLAGWLGLLCGLLIVGLSTTSSEAMNMIIASNMVQIYLSGVMWPIEAQVPMIKLISENLPLCYISRLLNNIVLKGWTIGHPAIVTGTAVTIGYICLHVIMLLFLSRIKKDAWLLKKC